MSYVFTDSERAQIQAAVSASSGITLNGDGTYSANAAVGSNAVPLYQTLSDIIGAHISSGAISGANLTDLKNAKLWLDVAIGANGNTGMHAAFIRAYTNRQGELRVGHAFSESEMQEASNAVARNLVNSLLFGDTPSGLLPWSLPRIDQIAGIDARAIGRTLFGPDSAQPLQPGDTNNRGQTTVSSSTPSDMNTRRKPCRVAHACPYPTSRSTSSSAAITGRHASSPTMITASIWTGWVSMQARQGVGFMPTF